MIYQRLLIVCLLLLPAGCSRKSPPAAINRATGAAAAAPSAAGAGAEGPAAVAGGVYEGRAAPEWGERLVQTQSQAMRDKAAIALAQLGEQGYPHLLAGMRSDSDAVRLASVRAISKAMLLAHQNEMIPLLMRMLKDPEPMIRRAAAGQLRSFGKAGEIALRDLMEMAADKNESPEVRQVAKASAEQIRNPKAREPAGGPRPTARKTPPPEKGKERKDGDDADQ
jgi:HEAT repeat protein